MEPLFGRATFENTMRNSSSYTICSNCSYALQLHSSNSARVSTPSPRFSRREPGDEANGLCARIYYQKHVATIETMSEASERIKARVIFMHVPYAARDGDMLSVYVSAYFRTPLCTEKQARTAVYILTGLTKF